MKKVCFFMATPFTLGGEQRVVSIISNSLIESGYDVTIMCTDMSAIRNNKLYNLSEKVKIGYVRGFNNKIVKRIRSKRWDMYYENLKTGKYKNNLSALKFINCDFITQMLLVNTFNKEDFDYVISLSTIYNTMLACISDKLNAKTIGWQHGSFEQSFLQKDKGHYNQNKFTKYMFKKLDKYVVLTQHDKKLIKQKFNENVLVINNPKSMTSNKVTNLENKQFLAVGRFSEEKNFSLLIDMFNEYHKINKEWKLAIVGEGELKEEYNKKIKEYNLQKFVSIKKFTNKISKHYLNSSVYLMSSFYEGWGMVIGEAIEFGLPVISFDISSAPEMIKDGYNGYIVNKNSLNKYVDSMIKISSDETLLKEFSQNSKIFSSNFDNKIVIKRWIDMFNNLDKLETEEYVKKGYVIVNN